VHRNKKKEIGVEREKKKRNLTKKKVEVAM
jgi:hypothetical protein